MLIVLCGIPGSGKTTLSNRIAEFYNASIYHYDEWRYNMKYQSLEAVRNKMYANIHLDLSHEIDVVVDDLHLKKEDRLKLLLSIKDIQCNKILIILNTPIDICILRNHNREARILDSLIYFSEKQFEIPALNEGWDSIIYYEGECDNDT